MARSVVEVIADAKRLAVEYRLLTGKPLGISGEVAEIEVHRCLGLELAPARTAGHDAIRHLGEQGGFKRSSQHSEVGGCDEHSKAAVGTVWTGAITFTRTAARRGARGTDKILACNRHGAEQRRCCAGRRSVAAGMNQMVTKGRRHATSDVQILGEAALRALPVICGA